jgi:hypothetical protein
MKRSRALHRRYGRAVHPPMPDMSWLYGGPDPRKHDLHERVAQALGWTADEVRSMSLAALREVVRPVNPGLAQELSMKIQSGGHIIGARRKARRPR